MDGERHASAGLGSAADLVTTLTYGCAHYGKSLFWYASELLFAFFLTEVGAVPADRMGLTLAAGLLVSAVIDVVVGSRLSHLLPSAASAGRWQLAGAIASAVSVFLLFTCYWLPVDARLAGALAMSLAFRLFYALYDIPQNSLISLATSGAHARTNVASMRYAFSGLAALTVAASLPSLLQVDAPSDRAIRFCIAALAFSAVAIVTAALLARALRAMRTASPAPAAGAVATTHLDGDVRLLIALMFVMSLAAPVFSKIEPYFATFVLRDPLMGGGVVLAVSIGMMVAQPPWSMLARRTSRLGMIGMAAGTLVLAAFGFLLVGQTSRGALMAAALAFGAASGGVGMAIWAGYGDAVARHARGREGWAYGLFTASAKLSLAVSGLMIGLLLARIDYRGADSALLVSAMVAPSIVAGMICTAVVVWRRHHDARASAGQPSISGRRSP